MPENHHIVLTQQSETKATLIHHGPIHFRYAYARSADTRSNDALGQDYLAVAHTNTRLAFVVCDGVSQSFFGDLAARILGSHLLGWIMCLSEPLDSASPNYSNLIDRLTNLTTDATDQVTAFQYPAGVPGMLQAALEKKRALGSESTFVTGVLDFHSRWYSLAWMGDSRVRIWDASGEQTARLGSHFITGERWSSRKGPVGNLHVYSDSLNSLTHLFAYTDGLSKFDSAVTVKSPSNSAVDLLFDEAFQQPNSDDACMFEWWNHAPRFDHPPEPVEELQLHPLDDSQVITWPAAIGATRYEVALFGKQGETLETLYTTELDHRFSSVSLRKGAVRVGARPLRNDEPGPWTYKTLAAGDPLAETAPESAQLLIESSESAAGAGAAQPSSLHTAENIQSELVQPPAPPFVKVEAPAQPPVVRRSIESNISGNLPVPPKKKSGRRAVLRYTAIAGLALCLFSSAVFAWYQSTQSPPAAAALIFPTETIHPPEPVAEMVIAASPTAAMTLTATPTAEPTVESTLTPLPEKTEPAPVLPAGRLQSITIDRLKEITPTGLQLPIEGGPAPVQPESLLFAPAPPEGEGPFTVLAVFPRGKGEVEAAAVSRVYAVYSPTSWNVEETLPVFTTAAVSNMVIAGIYQTSGEDGAVVQHFGLWQRTETGWQQLEVPIMPDNICALAFVETDLFVLEKNWALKRYLAAKLYQEPNTLITPDEQILASSSAEPVCNLVIGQTAADPNSVRIAASIDTNSMIAAIRLDETVDQLPKKPSSSPVRQFSYSEKGWWVSAAGVLYLRDFLGGELFNTGVQNTGLAVSPSDGTALVVPGDPKATYQAFAYDVRKYDPIVNKPVSVKLSQESFRRAERVYFSPDGKFLVTLSAEDGAIVWYSIDID